MKDFIEFAIPQNRWFAVHIIGGGVIAKLFKAHHETFLFTLVCVVALAFLWELYELYTLRGDRLKAVYGSEKRWFWDSIGDIAGAIVGALLVIL